GKPTAIVVLPDTPEPLTRLAASELQGYLAKLSGAHVTVTNASEAKRVASDQTLILLGGPARNPIVQQLRDSGVIVMPELKPEGFLIKTATWQQRPVVIVAANDDAGTLYGTYELLERLGITFRLTGDIVPAPSDVLSCNDLNSVASPAFTRRGFLHTLCFDSASAFSWSD